MNAHPEDMRAAKKKPAASLGVRRECEQMIRVIDEQIDDLHRVIGHLQVKRKEWTDRIGAEVKPGSDGTRARAPRGAIRDHILRELESVDDGLSANILIRRISALLPDMNPRSVRQALTKMAALGLLERSAGLWRFRK